MELVDGMGIVPTYLLVAILGGMGWLYLSWPFLALFLSLSPSLSLYLSSLAQFNQQPTHLLPFDNTVLR